MTGTLKLSLLAVRLVHQRDLATGAGEVILPWALGRKYPNAGREWALLGHRNVATTMIYTHVLNKGGLGVGSPADLLGGVSRERGILRRGPTDGQVKYRLGGMERSR
jgi:hypothetical protein